MTIRFFISLFTGLGMGTGIIISGMGNPAKILAFLDLAGHWDPSLGLVMATAILVTMPAFSIAKKRQTDLLGNPMQLPAAHQIDSRLLGGSIVFGIGWGLTSICPGPALIMLGRGMTEGAIVLAAMMAGFILFDIIQHFQHRPSQKNI